MHIHILGICGTFMGGIAALAKHLGHRVTGSDKNVYPPMSTQLENLGIELIEGFSPEQLDVNPDMVVIGNAMSRGNPVVEEVLNRKLPYTSGPQWLLDNFLKDKWVLAVAGTHGKTTTSSMLAWVLEYAKMDPGFLIGGIPENFGISARTGTSPFFVIEADEYDTAFFDKRSKFVHYRPNTVILNNLEFDHADIFNNLQDIQKQFHHLMRMVPGNGLVVSPSQDNALNEVLAMGCWTESQKLGTDWDYELLDSDGSSFKVNFRGEYQGTVTWSLIGEHNVANGIMALAAARHVGVTPAVAIEALAEFKNVKRRMEHKGTVNDITVYDDFAHHPTAITTTLAGLRAQVQNQRIIAVLEPRSNTMKMGIHKDTLIDSLSDADQSLIFEPPQLGWSMQEAIEKVSHHVELHDSIDGLIHKIVDIAKPNDHVLIMSNGGFGGIHDKLLAKLNSQAK